MAGLLEGPHVDLDQGTTKPLDFSSLLNPPSSNEQGKEAVLTHFKALRCFVEQRSPCCAAAVLATSAAVLLDEKRSIPEVLSIYGEILAESSQTFRDRILANLPGLTKKKRQNSVATSSHQ